MTAVHFEERFEDAIEAAMLAAGWRPARRRASALTSGSTSSSCSPSSTPLRPPRGRRSSATTAATSRREAKFAQRIAAELDQRGPLDVLRHGVKDHGVKISLAFFAPASTLSPELVELHAANRLSVTRQLRYSDITTDELDLALFVNGIPTATAELKNPLTGQDVDAASTSTATTGPRRSCFSPGGRSCTSPSTRSWSSLPRG